MCARGRHARLIWSVLLSTLVISCGSPGGSDPSRSGAVASGGAASTSSSASVSGPLAPAPVPGVAPAPGPGPAPEPAPGPGPIAGTGAMSTSGPVPGPGAAPAPTSGSAPGPVPTSASAPITGPVPTTTSTPTTSTPTRPDAPYEIDPINAQGAPRSEVIRQVNKSCPSGTGPDCLILEEVEQETVEDPPLEECLVNSISYDRAPGPNGKLQRGTTVTVIYRCPPSGESTPDPGESGG